MKNGSKSNLQYRLIYNTRTWRRLREAKLRNFPICECCECKYSQHIHHIVPLESAKDNSDRMVIIGFDEDNLASLCESCHIKIHEVMRLDEMMITLMDLDESMYYKFLINKKYYEKITTR